jgi:Flp pilus assembly protein TadD
VPEAVDQLRGAVERSPHDLPLQTQFARALWQHGDGWTAVAVLNSVLGIDGGYQEALRARGEIYADIGDARKAILDLERQSVRDRPSTRAARGLALAKLGDHSAASKEIQAAMTTAPHNGPVLFYAARTLALTGDKVSSWEIARRAIRATDPPLSPAHREIALKLTHHG